jgi:histidine triad (HIT) family protein
METGVTVQKLILFSAAVPAMPAVYDRAMTLEFAPMPYDATNVFAKILRAEIPSHRVFEDADTIAFMDVMPMGPGHTLVVPKAPCRNLLDADPAVLARLLPVAQIVARATRSAFRADGITVLQYNEAAGGQSVFHLHFHVIPRFTGVALTPHTGAMADPQVLAAHAQLVRDALKL